MARRGRKPASLPAAISAPQPEPRDPETFDYTDLAAEIASTMNAAKARIEVLTARINRSVEERDALNRMVIGAERALGLDTPTSSVGGSSFR